MNGMKADFKVIRKLTVLIFTVLIFTLPASSAVADITDDDIDVSWLAGLLTGADTFYINDEAQMYGLWAVMSDPVSFEKINDLFDGALIIPQKFLGKKILLDADLVLDKWEPAGKLVWTIGRTSSPDDSNSASVPFLGEFDGQGHKITYSFDRGDDEKDSALFAYLGKTDDENPSRVKNLVLDVTIAASNHNVLAGGVAALNMGVISDIVVSADIKCNGWAGGVAGYNANTVESCAVTGEFEINAALSGNVSRATGGIVGYNNGATVVVRDSRFTGNVRSSVSFTSGVAGQIFMGGIAGINKGGASIKNCEASGSYLAESNKRVTATFNTGGISGGSDETSGGYYYDSVFRGELSGNNVGGIVGKSLAILENCSAYYNFNNDFLQDSKNANVNNGLTLGGLVGFASDGVTLKNCYFDGNLEVLGGTKIKNSLRIGGFVGVSNSANISGSVASCDISMNTYDDGFAFYYGIGGLIGLELVTPTVKNSVYVGDIISDSFPNYITYGTLIGSLQSPNNVKPATFINVQWLAGTTTKPFGVSVTAYDNDQLTNVASVNTIAELPAVTAVLSPVAGTTRVNGMPLAFEVKLYPEGTTAATTIPAEWEASSDGPDAVLTVAPDADAPLKALAAGVAEGQGKIAVTVGDENGNDDVKLMGGATPTLYASVNVLGEQIPDNPDNPDNLGNPYKPDNPGGGGCDAGAGVGVLFLAAAMEIRSRRKEKK
jgi:hypothetical protein